jgi:hypothetical protein
VLLRTASKNASPDAASIILPLTTIAHLTSYTHRA